MGETSDNKRYDRKENIPRNFLGILFLKILNSAVNFARTQASCADINLLGSSVHNRSHSPDIRLPRFVRPAMRMGNLDTESNALAANLTLCHILTPPEQYFNQSQYRLFQHECFNFATVFINFVKFNNKINIFTAKKVEIC